MKISANSSCPCCSNKKYKKCCKVYHEGILPKTAKELMQSRFSAYSLGKADYIIKTTHKDNNDFTSDIDTWKNDILNFCHNTEFRRLDVLEFIDGEMESFVTFKATLFQNDQDVSFVEKSRFLKEDGRWFYVDGTFL